MNIHQLNRGNQLVELIKITEGAIKGLKELLVVADSDARDHKQPNINYDGLYNLRIQQYSDGSGKKTFLERYEGNREVVEAVIAVLEKQLKEFRNEMASL